MKRALRATASAVALTCVGAAWLLTGARPGTVASPILALRPGPIDRPLHIVAADFDRDGADDLLVANFEAGTLTLLLNQGDGTFVPHTSSPFAVGSAAFNSPTAGPLHMAVADLNPDDVDSDRVLNGVDNCPNVYNPADPLSGVQGDPDGNGIGDECQTLDAMGNPIDTDGDGRFDYDPSALPAPDPITAALDNCPRRPNPGQADLNNDHVGDDCAASPDVTIAETSLGGGSPFGIVRVRVNTGSGRLDSRPSKVTDVGPTEVLLGDFSGDGRPDLAVSNSGADTVFVYAGQGNGEFGNLPLGLMTGKGPQGMAAGDFDGDGDLDLAVANRGASMLGVYLNAGTALPDAVTTNLPTRLQPTVVLSGDLDGDACADLVVLDQDTLTCAGGSSSGSACSSDAGCPGGTCLPAGGKGAIEIFGASPCPGGTLTATSTIDLLDGERPRAGSLADFDLDGMIDLAVADFTGGQVLIYKGVGNGTFTAAGSLTGLSGPVALAVVDFDPLDALGPDPDLAVLSFADNRTDLFRNDGGLAFSPAPTTPASPWKATSALALFAADAAVAIDIVLLQRGYESDPLQCLATPPRVDVLSGIGNGFFRAVPGLSLAGPVCATGMTVADLRQDSLQDLLVVDAAGSTVTVVRAESSGLLSEGTTVPVGTGPSGAAVGSLIADPDDYDRDGVPDITDNCPTRYNPPFCRVTDPECAVDILCVDATHPAPICDPLDSMTLDPVTMQCDSDQNGVGDQCQLLDSACLPLDTDSDLVFDYNPSTKELDNCPWVFNNDQLDADMDGIGDACAAGVNDIVTVSLSAGELTVLTGDGSGSFRKAGFSPLTGFMNPTAALVGGFSLSCTSFFGTPVCDDKATNDIAVVEQGIPADPGDDLVTVLMGDGTGTFSTKACQGGTNNGDFCTIDADCPGGLCRTFGPVQAQGEPSALRSAVEQPICPSPATPTSDPGMRFDNDSLGTTLAVVEPDSSTLGIYLPSSAGLVPPPGHPAALPLASPPTDVSFVDLNQDGVADLVALSSGDGDPSTPNVEIYMGIANGLFYTDSSFNPSGIRDGATRIAAGNVDLATDITYPDIVLFDGGDAAPIVLTNILKERADIDGSGRVDGFDLAILAHAFGAVRGEDFTIQANGSLLQSGSGFSRVVVESGTFEVGMDLPDFALVCNRRLDPDRMLDPLAGRYGLPVDLNLDGVVDGEDLALLASLFGRSL